MESRVDTRPWAGNSSMAGVEEELWNIFTFYTLRGNPLDLTRLSVTQFLRLARDCQIVDDGRANIHEGRSSAGAAVGSRPQLHGGRRLGQAAVNLAFASVIQGRAKVPSEGYRDRNRHRNTARSSLATAAEHSAVKIKLSYAEFLDALVVLGGRMYGVSSSRSAEGGSSAARGKNYDRSVESTFQQLLMEHILPLASRRRPASIADAIRDPLVRDLLKHYRPAFREIFRFYAVSPSAAGHSSSSSSGSSSGSASGEGISNDTVQTATVESTGEQPREQSADAGLESALPLPQSPTSVCHVPAYPGASAEIDGTDITAAATASAASASASTAPLFCPAPASVKYFEATAPASEINSATAPAQQPLPHRTSQCPSSISWAFSQEGVAGGPEARTDGDVQDGESLGDCCGGSGRVGGSRRRAPPGRSSQSSSTARVATMNSMADALSHQCLLYFAADFGISGALVSALEVGEAFLSCDGRLAEALSGKSRVEDGPSGSTFTHRTGHARAGKGRGRPLTFHEFLEVLVRISLACFHPGAGKALETPPGSWKEPVGPGQCFRALLTHMWRRLHDSAELALNGVRAGGLRHRSSIQKGALLKGVKLFNEEMLSRWRTEGFLDFASSDTARGTATSLGSVLRCAPRQGHAAKMLRDMLEFEKGRVEVAAEPGGAGSGLQRHPGEERGDGGEDGEAAARNPGARETRVSVGLCDAHQQR